MSNPEIARKGKTNETDMMHLLRNRKLPHHLFGVYILCQYGLSIGFFLKFAVLWHVIAIDYSFC